MRRTVSLALALVPLAVLAAQPSNFAAQPPKPEEALAKNASGFLKTYCVSCHSGSQPSAGIKLDGADVAAIHKNAPLWRNVVRQVRERTMPPHDATQPTQQERDHAVEGLGVVLSALPMAADPGRVVLHRLNRTEYNNTVRDLFAITLKPADDFPADAGGGGGFDNNADTLFLPPVLMERYLIAATKVLDAAPTDRLFFVTPSATRKPRVVAKQILDFHASRAFRRPVQPAESTRLLALYDAQIALKKPHQAAVKYALKAVLVSPHFLFRIEQEPGQSGTVALNDYELASRLSYFLWSSMPDEALFKLAREKKLRQPGVVAKQIDRMLLDPKARALADSFGGQWLHVRDLYTTAKPDLGKFPEYTPELRDAMYQETVLFIESIFKNNESVLKLLDADYTYLNESLAKHYGIDGVSGKQLRRVALSGNQRGGVLTQASVLTITSYPQRTSPVLRGKWVLSEVLGAPPPPPPPVVATLSQNDKAENGLTFRQRLEKHREKPECSGCHSRMDPIGFGLENFDPIGRWRTVVGETPVDASGQLVGGDKFTGPAELKQRMLAKKDDFVHNLAERLLSYALGRGIEPYDAPVVKKIVDATSKDGYRAETMIREIALSLPFQYKHAELLQPPSTKKTALAGTQH